MWSVRRFETRGLDAALCSSRTARLGPVLCGHGRAWAHGLRLVSAPLPYRAIGLSVEQGAPCGVLSQRMVFRPRQAQTVRTRPVHTLSGEPPLISQGACRNAMRQGRPAKSRTDYPPNRDVPSRSLTISSPRNGVPSWKFIRVKSSGSGTSAPVRVTSSRVSRVRFLSELLDNPRHRGR